MLGVCCGTCVVSSELEFAAKRMLSATNQRLVWKRCCLSVSVFAADNVLSVANHCSLQKLCCL